MRGEERKGIKPVDLEWNHSPLSILHVEGEGVGMGFETVEGGAGVEGHQEVREEGW